MENTPTSRGFSRYEFVDGNGNECSLQKSSAAEQDLIWLGSNSIGLKHFKAGQGWTKLTRFDTIGEHYVANNRMHLTREQVKELLPLLRKFVKTGEI